MELEYDWDFDLQRRQAEGSPHFGAQYCYRRDVR